jgi:hypothetical protein
MYSQAGTQSAISQNIGRQAQQFDPRTALKNQTLNRGVSGNASVALAGQGSGLAARKLSPLAMAFEDASANAKYDLQRRSAAEQDGLQQLSRHNQAFNSNAAANQNMALAWQQTPMMQNLLGYAFGGF